MSVLSMVSDPQFQSLDPTDQQKALAGIDPDFGSLNTSDFQTAVTGLQKQAISRPDLVAPPKIASPSTDMQAAAPNGMPANDMQATPSEATPEGNAAAIKQREDTSSLGPVGNAVAQTGIGFAKGAGNTVENTVGKLIPGQAPTNDELASNNGWQSAGKIGENILEFMTGDEALKGLSLSSKFGLASKVAELAETSPTLAKAIDIGLNAIRQGTVSGGETLAKGGTGADALEAGVGGAALSGIAQSVLPAFGALKNLVTPADVQPELQGGIRSILSNAVEDSDQPESIRDAAQSAGDSKYADAKANFKILDDATGGNVSRFDNQLKNINRAIQNVTDDDDEAKLLTRKANLEASQEATFEQAKAAGVDPGLVDQAKTDYKQAQALYDLDSNIKKSVVSTSGRPGVTSPEALAKNPETVDPKKLATRVNAMYDSGRLQDALGEDGAKDLFNHANAQYQNFATAARKAATSSKVLRGAAKVALTGAGLGIAGHIAGHAASHVISVDADPAGTDSGTSVPDTPTAISPDAPPDVPSALTGKPSPDVLNALSDEQPATPRMATGRDYIDNPDTQAAIEKLYQDAQSTFNYYSINKAEHLIAIGQDNKASTSAGAAPGETRSLRTRIPSDSQAIVHTHPSTATPVPSPQDYVTATKTGIPNFVLSKDSIYVAMPGMDPNTTQHIKVADVSPAKHGKLNIKWNQ